MVRKKVNRLAAVVRWLGGFKQRWFAAATLLSSVSGASLEPNVKQFTCGCCLPLFGV